MNRLRIYLIATFIALPLAISTPSPSSAEKAPATWDNLVRVPSKRIKLVYVKPGADFSGYSKVMLDPVEIAFDKDWRRSYNNSNRNPQARISESDLQKASADGAATAHEIFAKALTEGGFPVVSSPGPDVLRLRVGVVDITVNAPDVMTAGRSRSYAPESGYATLVVEARDSVSGAILGRAADRQVAGSSTMTLMPRSSVSNRGDFRRIATSWAKSTVRGLTELKTRSPG
jgi:hypothetical protein